MTALIDSILEIADQFDAIVLDQWGVLHDGTAPYPNAVEALEGLSRLSSKLGVLSNSGKRARVNADRIIAMGFGNARMDVVMTSGEALWQTFQSRSTVVHAALPIEGARRDAATWAAGLDLHLTQDVSDAEAILLMGLPDGTQPDGYDHILDPALERGLPLYCSNPDLTSPRAGGVYVMSPGALARRYAEKGGQVYLYGKPHRPIFDAMTQALDCDPSSILMVGDSLHHDIQGATAAGWKSLLIQGGIHAPDIHEGTAAADIARLAQALPTSPPTYALADLR